ncbi:MAG TPA: aromatic ring-hydroxylating dioxygenase subunit alpha [Stellaceae bacterium]|nr:aromatic ring-hydroxylating dioxygenase subunit alpha [Stellaceae bacterium]
MTSAAQNERMTRTGSGTPCGALMRLYWQPAALSEELPPDRPAKPVRLMGQDFVLFRDEAGRLGLLDRHCPHRGADLAHGRLEDGGLRCLFHGWLFDVAGQCLETPAESEGSLFHTRMRQQAYPVVERNGIIFAYLGPGEPPTLPGFDCFAAPDAFTFAFKGLFDCNWLQALEVGIDPAHASFLHRFFEDEEPGANYGRQFRAASADSALPMTKILREFPRPHIAVEKTDYGLRIVALRKLDAAKTHVRVTNLVFPHGFVIPLSAQMTITQWHVPVDDESCYWYALFTSFDRPVDKAEMRRQRLALYTLPDYKPRVGRATDYGFDSAEQRNRTFTGMGFDINLHDQWAVESQGRIHDRTRENLGPSDTAIIAYRRMLMAALAQAEKGERPPMVLDAAAAELHGPIAIDGIGPSGDWQGYFREVDARRRRESAWAGSAG